MTIKALSILLLLALGVSCGQPPTKSSKPPKPPEPPKFPEPTKADIAPGLSPVRVFSWFPIEQIESTDRAQFIPMVYDRVEPREVQRFIRRITAKASQVDGPVVLQTHRWGGDYSGPAIWLVEGILTHRDDWVDEYLPGIWPNEGVRKWQRHTARLMESLVQAGVEVTGWPLDAETSISRWSAWYNPRNPQYRYSGGAGERPFTRIMHDPRWRSEPLLGLSGLTGHDILPVERLPADPAEAERLAHSVIYAVGRFVRQEAYRLAIVEPFRDAFPNAWFSDYSREPKPWFWESDEISDGLKLLAAAGVEVEVQPGIGDTASPSLYGGGTRWTHPRMAPLGDTPLERMLAHAAWLTERYGPANVRPWITSPGFGDSDGPWLSDDEYQALIDGLRELGITEFIWWSSRRADRQAEERAMWEAMH